LALLAKKVKREYIQQTSQKPASTMFKVTTQVTSPLFENFVLRPYNPAELYQKRGNYDLYDQMMDDDQVSAVMMLKKVLIIDCDWEIDVYDRKTGKENSDIKEFLEWNLQEVLGIEDNKLFEQIQLNMLTAKEYGFSLSEKIFEYRDTKKWGKRIVIKNIKTRPPHTFFFYQDDFGNITELEQDTDSGRIKIDYNKMIHYINNFKFDNPYGESELNEGIYRNWWSKQAIIKFWNIYIERYGNPPVVGKYDRKDKNIVDKFKKVLKNLQVQTGITIPLEYEIKLLEANSKGESVFERAINYYNMMIARKLLIPDLMGFSGKEISGGSYALGKEHFDIFYKIIELDRKYVEMLLTRHIIQPLIFWNFGNKYTGKFIFQKVDSEREEKHAELWIKAVQTGMVDTDIEQWNHFFKTIGYPEQKEKEKEEQPIKIKEEPKTEQLEQLPEQQEQEMSYRKYYRELTEYEKKVDYAKIDRVTQEIEDKYKKRLANVFKLIINGLVNDIKTKKIIERKRLDLIGKLKLRNLSKLKQEIKNMLKESLEFGKQMVKQEIGKRKKKYAIVTTGSEFDTEQVTKWLDEIAEFITTAEEAYIYQQIKPILIEAVREGTGIKDIVKMIDEAMRGYDLDLGASKIERIVRTNINRAFNQGRKELFEEVRDEIVAYQFSAILDGRTSEICASLDKKIFRPSEIAIYNPPLHFNCRSQLVAIFRDEPFDGYSEMPAIEPAGGGFLKLKE